MPEDVILISGVGGVGSSICRFFLGGGIFDWKPVKSGNRLTVCFFSRVEKKIWRVWFFLVFFGLGPSSGSVSNERFCSNENQSDLNDLQLIFNVFIFTWPKEYFMKTCSCFFFIVKTEILFQTDSGRITVTVKDQSAALYILHHLL